MIWGSVSFFDGIAPLMVVWLVSFNAYNVCAAPTSNTSLSDRQMPYSINALLRSAVYNDSMTPRTYTPPSTCQETCGDLLAALAKCEDDSCVCSQTGVDAFFE